MPNSDDQSGTTGAKAIADAVKDATPAARDAIMRAHLDTHHPLSKTTGSRPAPLPVACLACNWKGWRKTIVKPCPQCGGEVQVR